MRTRAYQDEVIAQLHTENEELKLHIKILQEDNVELSECNNRQAKALNKEVWGGCEMIIEIWDRQNEQVQFKKAGLIWKTDQRILWGVGVKTIDIREGMILESKWGYDVEVCPDEDGEFYGKLICEKGHPCENIPYDLCSGNGYDLKEVLKGESEVCDYFKR